MPLHQTCQLTMCNFIRQDCYIVHTTYMSAVQCHSVKLCRCSCNIYACWPCVTATNTAAVQTCLLVECCCKMDACWTVATQSACLPIFCLSILHVCCRCASLSAIPASYGVSLSAVPAGVVPHYRQHPLVWCLTTSHACCGGASLYVMPSRVVPHYQPCLLVWCLTIGNAFGVVPDCRPCLLVWCLTIGHASKLMLHYQQCLLVWCHSRGHACWSVAAVQPISYWSSADWRRMVATCTEVPLHQACLLIWCHSHICLLVQCNSIRHACLVYLFRYVYF